LPLRYRCTCTIGDQVRAGKVPVTAIGCSTVVLGPTTRVRTGAAVPDAGPGATDADAGAPRAGLAAATHTRHARDAVQLVVVRRMVREVIVAPSVGGLPILARPLLGRPTSTEPLGEAAASENRLDDAGG
jgi:hypothetical protein